MKGLDMPTLVIHAPHSQVQENQKQSFNQTLVTGRGDGYAISNGLFQQLSPGDDVVVICKVHRKQAVGQIKELIPTVKTGTGMQRYDVIMVNLKAVPFTHGNTALNRNGVTVI
jgi:hypothetical protein